VSFKSVDFNIGNELSDGVFELDVQMGNTTIYNIISVDEYNLVFADQATRTLKNRPTELSTGNRVFFRIK
jgi:hypothetical protein